MVSAKIRQLDVGAAYSAFWTDLYLESGLAMVSPISLHTRLLFILICTLLNACSGDDISDEDIDCGWYKQSLIENHLEQWLQASPTASGYFLIGFDRRWVPLNRDQDTLVSQSRMIYALATGYELSGDTKYLEAMNAGLAFMLTKQRNFATGEWYHRVDLNGKPTVPGVHRYGNSFVIFGLSHASRVTQDTQYSVLATETWDSELALLAAHPSAAPYFPHRVDHALQPALLGGQPPGATRQGSQNSLLHLYEAGLELYVVAPTERLRADILGITDFVLEVVSIDNGRIIPSWHDNDWHPLYKDGGDVDPGHQLEWAHFVDRATRFVIPPQYTAVAERILEFPLRYGFHPDGGLASGLNFEGKIIRGSRNYWEQAEALSTVMHFAHWNWRDDLWPLYQRQLQFIQRNMIDKEYGGWFADSRGSSPPALANPQQMSSWQEKSDIYHITNMYREGLTICGELKRSAPAGLE